MTLGRAPPRIGLFVCLALRFCAVDFAFAAAALPPRAPTLDPPVMVAPSRSYRSGEADTGPYNHGDPTAEEQLMLEFINRARANPAAEGVRLQTTTDPDILNAYSYFQVDPDQFAVDFASYPARPPLARSPRRMITGSARRIC